MSVHVLSWVLRNSETTLADRLVLLVLADHAKEDGTAAWPGVSTIASEARLSERQARYSLRALEDAGAIIETGQTKQGCHIYTVVMTGADSAGGQNPARPPEQTAPEPSLEQPSGPTALRAVGTDLVTTDFKVTAQTVLADVVDELQANDIAVTKRHRGMLAKQVDDALKSGFPREQVMLAAVTAMRRGEPQNMHFIVADLASAAVGQHISRRAYREALEDASEIEAFKRRRDGAS